MGMDGYWEVWDLELKPTCGEQTWEESSASLCKRRGKLLIPNTWGERSLAEIFMNKLSKISNSLQHAFFSIHEHGMPSPKTVFKWSTLNVRRTSFSWLRGRVSRWVVGGQIGRITGADHKHDKLVIMTFWNRDVRKVGTRQLEQVAVITFWNKGVVSLSRNRQYRTTCS